MRFFFENIESFVGGRGCVGRRSQQNSEICNSPFCTIKEIARFHIMEKVKKCVSAFLHFPVFFSLLNLVPKRIGALMMTAMIRPQVHASGIQDTCPDIITRDPSALPPLHTQKL